MSERSRLASGLAAGRHLRQVTRMSAESKPPEATAPKSAGDAAPEKRLLSPAAERALAEAAARRAESDGNPANQPKEIAGRDGPEPTRYGDWEINGLTSDF
jgi:hypothetical protein